MSRLLVPILFLLAAAVPASADDLAEGTKIVKQRCLACHNQEKLIVYASRTPAGERVAKWERFLPSHYLPKAEERTAATAWLKENAGS
jgi:mono/diheme cytochrome c family protein